MQKIDNEGNIIDEFTETTWMNILMIRF